MKKIITKSAGETKEFAKKTAKSLKAGDMLGLVGDLGGGKTTFIKGLAEAFGIKQEVLSPTFTLIKEYKIIQNTKHKTQKVKKIYHLDLYRLRTKREAEELGLGELFNEEQAIFVIEWADKIKNFLPKRTKWLEFDFVNENTRKIIIKNDQLI